MSGHANDLLGLRTAQTHRVKINSEVEKVLFSHSLRTFFNEMEIQILWKLECFVKVDFNPFFTYYEVRGRHVLTAELRPVLAKFAFILFSWEVPCFQQYISKYHLVLVKFTKILNIFLVICGLHMSFGIPQKLPSSPQFAPSVRKFSNLLFLFLSYLGN